MRCMDNDGLVFGGKCIAGRFERLKRGKPGFSVTDLRA